MSNQPPAPRISAYQSPHFAIPAYYNLFPEQQPTHPGWYFCQLANGGCTHLFWIRGSFRDDWNQQREVTHWIELPPFITPAFYIWRYYPQP